MSSTRQDITGTLIIHIDLDTLQNLKIGRTVLAGNNERATARLTLVADHTAGTDRTIKLRPEQGNPLGRSTHERKLDTKFTVKERLYLVTKTLTLIRSDIGNSIKFTKIPEDDIPQFQTLAHEDLLVAGSHTQEPVVGDIVNVLDGNQFILKIIQVINQSPVTGRSEQKTAIFLSEWLVLHIHSHGIGSLVLERERDVVLHAILFLISSIDLLQSSREKRLELRRNSENNIGRTIGIPHIILSLNKMLSKGSPALPVRISVETDYALRLRAIAEPAGIEDLVGNILAIIRIVLRLTEHLLSIESEILDAGSKLADRRIRARIRTVFQSGKPCENILEHTGSCSGSWHELALSDHRGIVTISDSLVSLLLAHHLDSALRSRRSYDIHPRKSLLETLNLSLNGLY